MITQRNDHPHEHPINHPNGPRLHRTPPDTTSPDHPSKMRVRDQLLAVGTKTMRRESDGRRGEQHVIGSSVGPRQTSREGGPETGRHPVAATRTALDSRPTPNRTAGDLRVRPWYSASIPVKPPDSTFVTLIVTATCHLPPTPPRLPWPPPRSVNLSPCYSPIQHFSTANSKYQASIPNAQNPLLMTVRMLPFSVVRSPF
jgi:hypothetical protein